MKSTNSTPERRKEEHIQFSGILSTTSRRFIVFPLIVSLTSTTARAQCLKTAPLASVPGDRIVSRAAIHLHIGNLAINTFGIEIVASWFYEVAHQPRHRKFPPAGRNERLLQTTTVPFFGKEEVEGRLGDAVAEMGTENPPQSPFEKGRGLVTEC